MSDTTNTSIEELDSHMKDLKVLAIILGLMFFITLGYLYLMTISDDGSAGHPASIHDEVEAVDEADAEDEADTTTEEGEADSEADTTESDTGADTEGDAVEGETNSETDAGSEEGSEAGSADGETGFRIDGQIYQLVI